MNHYLIEITLKQRIGLIIPFSKVTLNSTSFHEAPNSKISDKDFRIFSPITDRTYPGENPHDKKISFLSIRDHKATIHGRVKRDKNDNVIFDEKGPFNCLWDVETQPVNDLVTSVLANDKFVNPSLLPKLINWIGYTASPLHVYMANFSYNTRLFTIRCTNQTNGQNWQQNVRINAKDEKYVSIELVGMVNPGSFSILIEIFEDQHKIYEDTAKIEILPDDHLLLRIHDVGRDWYNDTVNAVVCWINPHELKIDQWISDSRNHIIKRQFLGSHGNPKPQIKALWQKLQDIGITYVNRSYSIGRNERIFHQRVTKPKDTLRYQSGNCIDLTVLFASAMEQLSLEPIIFLIPGHAFLGWETPNYEPGYLETTMIGDSTFEDALIEGENKYRANKENFNKARNFKIIKVSDQRKTGLLPI